MSRPHTLRWRLVATTSAVTAAVTLVLGGVTIFAIHGYLLGQVDSDLRAASHRSLSSAGVVPPAPSGRQDARGANNGQDLFVGSPGQAADTAVAVIVKGKVVVEGYIDDSGIRRALSARDQAVMLALPTDSRPYTRDLGGGLGSYRFVSTTIRPGTVLVTGLPLDGMQSTIEQLILIVAALTAAGILVAAGACALIVRRALRPLGRVAAAASAVTELTLDRGEVPRSVRVSDADIVSGSEVGHVGAALNRLLGHVGAALDARQAADEKVRRFVADASHELRTPLATVRAYAELSRREYVRVPVGLKRNLDRIESETIRMTSLVDDLLLLARLDSEPELDLSEVDLSEIVVDAVRDARAVGPENTWLIDMDEEPVLVTGDAARLRQVVVNLLTNARVHCPAGTVVRASLYRTAEGATLEVSDNGPGIEPRLMTSIFERFVRGDESRDSHLGSTGLGLAIVQAVIEAHDGEVVATSTPGETRFRIRLRS